MATTSSMSTTAQEAEHAILEASSEGYSTPSGPLFRISHLEFGLWTASSRLTQCASATLR